MTDEVETTPAEQSAPEIEVTAAPETVEETEAPAQEVEEQAPKTFTQEELDDIVARRLAREERKWRRQQPQPEAPRPAANPGDLSPEDFDTVEAYVDAVATRKAEELISNQEASRYQRELAEAYYEREEAAREKYADFQQVAYNDALPVTNEMALAIQAADNGPELLYHLGSNPKLARKIADLHPLLQAREIGKLEAQLTAAPPVRKTTAAPAPIEPVSGRSSGAPVFDTTDPRSIGSMTTSQWIEAERQRQMKRMGSSR